MLSFLWLLRMHGLYGLHANALVKDGAGFLIAGNTGSGKSTTALSLIRQGWRYLSDDITLLRQGLEEIEAAAFPKRFSYDPRLADFYPELNGSLKFSWNGQKKFMDIESVYPGSFLPACIPGFIVFPAIVAEDESRLARVSSTEALILLMQNSGGIMIDREMAVQHIEILKRLVNQVRCYQLYAGSDLYERPDKISEILKGSMAIN